MEIVIGILVGIAIASVGVFCGLLLWMAWNLKRGITDLRNVLNEISASTKTYAALGEAVPIFKKLAEQGDRIYAGLVSVDGSIKAFSRLAFKNPPSDDEPLPFSAGSPQVPQTPRSEGKVYTTDEVVAAEKEEREELRKQGVSVAEPSEAAASALREGAY